MNKYQEALDNLYRRSTDTHFYIPMGEDKLWKNTLQELVDKATPKKTIKEPIIRDKYRQYKNYCPVCKQELLILGDYCLHCGQKVDWSDE